MESGKMGLFSCIALIVGACVGSAIFSISGITICVAGGYAVLSWAVAAVIYMGYGMLLAELSAKYPDSGGIYMFPRRAIGGRIGRILAFFSGWGYVVSNIVAICFSAVFAGTYFAAGFPEISGYVKSEYISLIALLISSAILFLNTRQSQSIQNILVLFLVCALLVYCGFAFLGEGFSIKTFYSGPSDISGLLSAVPLALVAYGGCVVIPFMVSQVRNPVRNVPLSLFLGLLAVAILYVAVVTAVAGTLPVSVMQHDGKMMIPLFASVSDGALSCYPILLRLLSICGTIALMTTIIALMRVNSKAIQIMSDRGILPDFISSDRSSVTIMTAIAALMCFLPAITVELITSGALLNVVSMAVTIIALLVSRKHHFEYDGFRAPLGVILPILVLLVFLLCYIPDLLSGIGLTLLFTISVYAVGILFYIVGLRKDDARITGIVVHGKGHGAQHGIPTANLQLFEGERMPSNGVWCTDVFVDGYKMKGVTNVGLRPSDDNSDSVTIETLVIDFSGDLYGKRMTLQFGNFIRETRSFASLDELRIQIERDIEFRRKIGNFAN